MPITITEGLAEIKTIGKRITSKQEFILQNLARPDGVKDPLTKDGGSAAVVTRERQSIVDLETRVIAIRRAIQEANIATTITVEGVSRTMADWLTWRRDVAPGQKLFLAKLRQQVAAVRAQAQRNGATVVAASAQVVQSGDMKPTDILVNIDEGALAAEGEKMEAVLGALDGQLSLKNATVTINV